MIVTIQVCMAAIIYFLWTPGVPQTTAATPVEPP
jgi:hypothetical protein